MSCSFVLALDHRFLEASQLTEKLAACDGWSWASKGRFQHHCWRRDEKSFFSKLFKIICNSLNFLSKMSFKFLSFPSDS